MQRSQNQLWTPTSSSSNLLLLLLQPPEPPFCFILCFLFLVYPWTFLEFHLLVLRPPPPRPSTPPALAPAAAAAPRPWTSYCSSDLLPVHHLYLWTSSSTPGTFFSSNHACEFHITIVTSCVGLRHEESQTAFPHVLYNSILYSRQHVDWMLNSTQSINYPLCLITKTSGLNSLKLAVPL